MSFSQQNICLLILVTAISVFAFHLPTQAQTITENITLSFGRVVLVDNNAPRSVVLLPSGGYTADPAYIFFSSPRLASVSVDGFTPLTELNVTVNPVNLTTSGGGGVFFSTADTFTNPTTITTDASGSAMFDIGATLISNGSGASFIDSDYTGTYTITVSE